MITYNSNF